MDRSAFQEEYPFEEKFIPVDGLHYHYIDEGDENNDPILMVHGNPTWSFAWRNLVKEFSNSHRTIAVDHIGCGMSEKPQDYPYRLDNHISNLVSLIEHLDLKNITLIAHDWGGAIGIGATGRCPERFKKVVLMNTAAFRSQRIPFRIAVCRIPLLGSLGVRGLNAFAKAAITMAVTKPLPPKVAEGFLAPYSDWDSRIAVDRFVKDIPFHVDHPSYSTLVQVETALEQWKEKPALLIWGMKDWCFSPEFLREFQKRLPNAESLEIPDAGHYVFEDAKDAIIARVRKFLK